MTALARVFGSAVVGLVGFAVVTVAVAAAVEPRIEFSLLVGLPLGVYAGVTLVITTATGLRYRTERADGTLRAATRRRFRAAVAAMLALVCTGAVGSVVFLAVDGTTGLQILLFGLPVVTAGIGLLALSRGE